MSPTSRPPSPRRAPRILLWVGACLGVLLLFGAYVLHQGLEALRGKYEPQLDALRKEATDNVDFYCEQQEVLAADPWFHESRTQGDAGPLLNAWVGWDPKPEQPKGSPLAIPAHLPQSNTDFKDWLSSPVDVSTLDFGWMKQLHAYDRWDFLRNSPVPLGERIDWATTPVPNLVSMQLWAKFRLLHGLRTGQPLEAARDVRHLAWLLYRTETLLGGAVGAALLQFEQEAHASLPNPPPEWRPLGGGQVERMRALLMSGLAFSNLAVPVDVARKARRCGVPGLRCSAMAEASFLARYVQPVARDAYRQEYTTLEEDLAALPCATSLTRTLWERGLTLQDSQEGMREQPRWLRMLPRRYFGGYLAGLVLSLSTPSFKRLNEFRAKLASSATETR